MINIRGLVAAFFVILLTSCASLPPQAGRARTYALTDTQATRLGAAFAPQDQQHPDESAFHLLPDSVDALVARIVLMEYADRSLDLQYYIWHDDLTGRELAAAMLKRQTAVCACACCSTIWAQTRTTRCCSRSVRIRTWISGSSILSQAASSRDSAWPPNFLVSTGVCITRR